MFDYAVSAVEVTHRRMRWRCDHACNQVIDGGKQREASFSVTAYRDVMWTGCRSGALSH